MNGTVVKLALSRPGVWTENEDATFGPFSKKGGRFTDIAPVSSSKSVLLTFPSAAAATAFVAEIFGAENAASCSAASALKRASSGGGASSSVPNGTITAPAKSKLMGATVVFTGEPAMGKTAAGAAVERCGGKVATAVSKKTTFLVCSADGGMYGGSEFDPKNSTKGKKASSLGVKMLSEEEFLSIVGDEEAAEGEQKKRRLGS